MTQVNINVWFSCNARCVFCVVGITDRAPVQGSQMPLSAIENRLVEAYAVGAVAVTFSGGEPTIYPHIVEAAAIAREIGYKYIEVKTNGIRLADPAFARRLVNAGVNKVSVSIHGPSSAVHDALVGVRGAYCKTLKGIENVCGAGATFNVPTCIQAANYRFLPATVQAILSLGPEACLPTFIEPSGSAGARFDELVPYYRDVVPFLEEAVALLEGQQRTEWALHGFPLCMLRGFEKRSYDLVRRDRESHLATEENSYFDYELKNLRGLGALCSACALKCACNGPWRTYTDRRGWSEFMPLLGTSPRQILSTSVLISALFPRSSRPRTNGDRPSITVSQNGGTG